MAVKPASSPKPASTPAPADQDGSTGLQAAKSVLRGNADIRYHSHMIRMAYLGGRGIRLLPFTSHPLADSQPFGKRFQVHVVWLHVVC